MNQSEELIDRLKEGDEPAFKEIVELWQDVVYNTVVSIVQQAEDAEDVTQDVFLQVYQSVSSFKGESKFSTWLYRIATRKALDHVRKKKRKKRLGTLLSFFGSKGEEQYHPVEFHHPGVLLDNKEKAGELFKALQKLSDKQRVAFTLNKIEGLNSPEIAEIMNTTLQAVESLLVRAKANLKKELTAYYLQKND